MEELIRWGQNKNVSLWLNHSLVECEGFLLGSREVLVAGTNYQRLRPALLCTWALCHQKEFWPAHSVSLKDIDRARSWKFVPLHGSNNVTIQGCSECSLIQKISMFPEPRGKCDAQEWFKLWSIVGGLHCSFPTKSFACQVGYEQGEIRWTVDLSVQSQSQWEECVDAVLSGEKMCCIFFQGFITWSEYWKHIFNGFAALDFIPSCATEDGQ